MELIKDITETYFDLQPISTTDLVSIISSITVIAISFIAIIISKKQYKTVGRLNYTIFNKPNLTSGEIKFVTYLEFTNLSVFPVYIKEIKIKYFRFKKRNIAFKTEWNRIFKDYRTYINRKEKLIAFTNLFLTNPYFYWFEIGKDIIPWFGVNNDISQHIFKKEKEYKMVESYQTLNIPYYNKTPQTKFLLKAYIKMLEDILNTKNKLLKYANEDYVIMLEKYRNNAKYFTSIKLYLSNGKKIKMSLHNLIDFSNKYNTYCEILENSETTDTQAPEKE